MVSYQSCLDSKTPYCFPNRLLTTGGGFGVLEGNQGAAGGLGAGAPSAEGALSALAGVRGRSPRENFAVLEAYK